MQRATKKVKDKEVNDVFEHIFRNAMGSPVIFDSEPTATQMKANTWGKVSGVNTALYIRFVDGGAIKITGSELS